MDSLAPELLRTIVLAMVRDYSSRKNDLLPLRLVNKRFDFIVREYIFKTVQLDYTRLARNSPTSLVANLVPVGHLSQALYCDMMAIRDEEEIARLFQMFNCIHDKVPEMTTLLQSMHQYCMGETTFDEVDFQQVMQGLLHATPNMTRLKLSLPFQIFARAGRTATVLLATTFDCFAQRPPSFTKPLEILVLDHVSDSTVIEIGRNPIDLRNALITFRYLKNLIMSIKRQEPSPVNRRLFANCLWLLISQAENLESLCLSGWNVKSRSSRRNRPNVDDVDDWHMKSLPYKGLDVKRTLTHLRFLELRRVDVDPLNLIQLIEQNSTSLRELYLIQVYLKVLETPDHEISALWIGREDLSTKDADCVWLAKELRDMKGLNLDILRVTELGYSEFSMATESNDDAFDLKDPKGLNRTLDERFVAAFLNHPDEETKANPLVHKDVAVDTVAAVQPDPSLGLVSQTLIPTSNAPSILPVKLPKRLSRYEFDAAWFQRFHNTTSHWKTSIDQMFENHNETAMNELQNILGVADRGVALLSDEIDRINLLRTQREAALLAYQ